MYRVMRSFYLRRVVLASLSICVSTQALSVNENRTQNQRADETIVWRRAPIQLTLPVGKERFVTFPTEVQFGYNTHLLPPSVLRVENDNRTLYLMARKPFRSQRVQAKLANGSVILMDLSAKKQAEATPVDIVLPKTIRARDNIPKDNRYIDATRVNYVTLTRYAIQQLYAPERLLRGSSSITRFPMETTHVVPLFYDGSVSAMPLASWRGSDLYVTALWVKNGLNQPLRLDPRWLCGDWKTASTYPQSQLAPRGTPLNRDASTLFVVSDRPFSQAIQSCFH